MFRSDIITVILSGVTRLFAMPGHWAGRPFIHAAHIWGTCPSSYEHQYSMFKMCYASLRIYFTYTAMQDD